MSYERSHYKWKQFSTSIRFVFGSLILFTKCSRQSFASRALNFHTRVFISVNSEANARRIQMVESCFGSSGEQLLIPGRVLVGEGVLTKMCRKRPKPRQFFLFNDILVYGNIIIGKKKYNKQHIIPLEEVQLQGLDDTPREFSICRV